MAFDPAVVYLVAASIVVATLIIISVFCNGKGSKKPQQRANQNVAARPRENAPPGARARRRPVRRNRMQMANEDSDEDGMAPADEDEAFLDEMDVPEGKIGAKKLRKLQEKAEKRRQREIELQDREERKEREKKQEEQRKKDEAERAAEEAVKAEEERLKKEEQERKEHEEYLKMKEMFSVDEEGETEQIGEEESQSLLQKFIDYIKEMKVVMLEDLAAHFQLKTQNCIERIQQLQADGLLTGVIDDRGKFIYITMEELESVAKYIRQHGRVSIADLADSSNRLINLNPDNAEVQKKLFIGDNATDLMDVEEVAA